MCDFDKYSDEELIVMFRQGSLEIEDYLMEKYKNFVRAKARAMYLIGGDTDDLIQEGMIGLFKAIRDYDDAKEASFLTFARLCIDRQLYHAIESSNRLKNQPLNYYVSLSDSSSEDELFEHWEESPESIVLDRENMKEMIMAIRQACSPFENHVLDLYMRGYDYRQIAEMMDKTPKSIDNAIQRIRNKAKMNN